MLRYIFYREHKYVLFAVTELERLIAKTDFTINAAVEKIVTELTSIQEMLHFHAQHEDKFHTLLRAKNSQVHYSIEQDHRYHVGIFTALQQKLSTILACTAQDERILLGRDFYLAYREFEVENLRHLNEEERVIMPELQRLYPDSELMKIEADTYERMTVEEMDDMIGVLFPQMNADDHQAFLQDIKKIQPKKFSALTSWPGKK
jgi:hypothetical protein